MRALPFALAILLLSLPPASSATPEVADESEAPAFDVLHLAGTVYMLRSDTPIANPSTVVSVGADGVFLVDPNLESVGPSLLPTIRRLGPGPLRFVTSTHFHGDHTENYELLAKEAPAATAFVPHAQRERLATGEVVYGERPLQPAALPALTFEGTLTLRFNGETIDVMTLPHRRGHTDGDAVVYFREAGVLAVGDYLFLDKFPILDDSGDLEGYLANIAYLLATFPADTLVVPGHGRFRPDAAEAATMADFRRNYDRLRESIDIVRWQLAEGRTADEIVARGLPESFRSYGARPRFVSEERWIRFVVDYYRSPA